MMRMMQEVTSTTTGLFHLQSTSVTYSLLNSCIFRLNIIP